MYTIKVEEHLQIESTFIVHLFFCFFVEYTLEYSCKSKLKTTEENQNNEVSFIIAITSKKK